MRFNGFDIPKSLILTADALNTLQGGMSQPSIDLSREGEGYLLKVRIPGVSPEKMQIELKNNQIFIFYHISIENEDPSIGIRSIPYHVGYVNIPFDVDIKKVRAVYEDKQLKVLMPFNEFEGGYHRRINIENI